MRRLSAIFLLSAALVGCGDEASKDNQNASSASPQAAAKSEEFNKLVKFTLQLNSGMSLKLARKNLENKDLNMQFFAPSQDESANQQPLGDEANIATLFVFFTSWCEPCLVEIATLNSLATKHADKLRIIGVLLEEKSDDFVADLVAKNDVKYEIANGGANFTFMQALGGFSGIPYAALYDKTGTNIANYTGLILEEMLDIDITRAIK